MDYAKKALNIRKQKNVLKIIPNVAINNIHDLSFLYTPGVAKISELIYQDKKQIRPLTIKKNSVAIITDGSAVLGLGNIGPEAALPVMEGKALLFSHFADIDAFPICLATQDTGEIIETIRNIAPAFGGINLEDISAPRCFTIEDQLQDLGIPVMHDDQHGTAVVVLAGLINALKVVKKDFNKIKIVISGAGAAGTAIMKMLLDYSKNKANIIVLDSRGAICLGSQNLTHEKSQIAKLTRNNYCNDLHEVIKKADVFIGVSRGNILTEEMVNSMNNGAIVFALANPTPEIDPRLAKNTRAKIIATGRSDFPNQINNVLAFPGIFRGALDAQAKKITQPMLLAAAKTLAQCVAKPTAEKIIPSPFEKNLVNRVADAVKKAA